MGDNSVLTFLQVLAIFSCNCIVCLAIRFIYQIYKNKITSDTQSNKINIAIVGAGSVRVSLAKDLKANKYSKYSPIYFIDKDKDKTNVETEVNTEIKGTVTVGINSYRNSDFSALCEACLTCDSG